MQIISANVSNLLMYYHAIKPDHVCYSIIFGLCISLNKLHTCIKKDTPLVMEYFRNIFLTKKKI